MKKILMCLCLMFSFGMADTADKLTEDTVMCYYIGIDLYMNKAYKESAKYFKDCCDRNHAESCFYLGNVHEIAMEVKKAFNLYKKSCDNGSLIGCFGLATLYEHGKGVKQDYFKAVKLYEKSCVKSLNSAGCYNLGLMYLKGNGVKKSKAKALSYFGKACDYKFEKGLQGLRTF